MNTISKVEWRDVPGYEGIYEVSNTGFVRTSEGKTEIRRKNGKEYEYRRKQIVLKETFPAGRDVRVNLYKDGKVTKWMVHRLVALVFIGEPPEGLNLVNHLDGNPKNNRVENLEWSDHSGNGLHAYEMGLNRGRGHDVRITHEPTQATFFFNSLRKASRFMGKGADYLSDYRNGRCATIDKEWSVAFV